MSLLFVRSVPVSVVPFSAMLSAAFSSGPLAFVKHQCPLSRAGPVRVGSHLGLQTGWQRLGSFLAQRRSAGPCQPAALPSPEGAWQLTSVAPSGRTTSRGWQQARRHVLCPCSHWAYVLQRFQSKTTTNSGRVAPIALAPAFGGKRNDTQERGRRPGRAPALWAVRPRAPTAEA